MKDKLMQLIETWVLTGIEHYNYIKLKLYHLHRPIIHFCTQFKVLAITFKTFGHDTKRNLTSYVYWFIESWHMVT